MQTQQALMERGSKGVQNIRLSKQKIKCYWTVVHGIGFYTVKRTTKNKPTQPNNNWESNLRECNLQWNKFIRGRDRIRLLGWKLQRNGYNKSRARGVSTMVKKNEKQTNKKRIHFLNTIIIPTWVKFQPGFCFFPYTWETLLKWIFKSEKAPWTVSWYL